MSARPRDLIDVEGTPEDPRSPVSAAAGALVQVPAGVTCRRCGEVRWLSGRGPHRPEAQDAVHRKRWRLLGLLGPRSGEAFSETQ